MYNKFSLYFFLTSNTNLYIVNCLKIVQAMVMNTFISPLLNTINCARYIPTSPYLRVLTWKLLGDYASQLLKLRHDILQFMIHNCYRQFPLVINAHTYDLLKSQLIFLAVFNSVTPCGFSKMMQDYIIWLISIHDQLVQFQLIYCLHIPDYFTFDY